jgi:hypothetical protein
MSETRAGKGAAHVPRQRQRGAHSSSSRASAPLTGAASGSGAEPVEEEQRATRWVGWVFFAAVLMTIVGAFEIVSGLTALLNSGYFLVESQDLLVSVNFAVWGWLHIALGALAVGAGLSLLAGRTWARIVAIAMAMVNAVVNLAFMAAHPLWTVGLIALDVVLIYAIAVHGKEVTAPGA